MARAQQALEDYLQAWRSSCNMCGQEKRGAESTISRAVGPQSISSRQVQLISEVALQLGWAVHFMQFKLGVDSSLGLQFNACLPLDEVKSGTSHGSLAGRVSGSWSRNMTYQSRNGQGFSGRR